MAAMSRAQMPCLVARNGRLTGKVKGVYECVFRNPYIVMRLVFMNTKVTICLYCNSEDESDNINFIYVFYY